MSNRNRFFIRRKLVADDGITIESGFCFGRRVVALAPQRRSQRLMGGGHMQQTNAAAAATALYDGALNNAGPGNEAGDAVMARWLQSAGLQHLGSPVASAGTDQRHLPNLLMQVVTSSFRFLHMLLYGFFSMLNS